MSTEQAAVTSNRRGEREKGRRGERPCLPFSPSSLLPFSSQTGLDAIYTRDWKDRLRDYFARGQQFAAASGYWAFDFERQWAKHRRAVAQELRLVGQIGYWMPAIGRKVLVLGSWLGAEAIAYALCGAEVTAVDLDAEALALSEELAGRYGTSIRTLAADAATTSLATEQFDLVSCSQVLEHLPPHRQPAPLGEMWRLCRPGGLLWIDTPNQLALCDQHDTGLYFVHWLPRPIKTRLARWLGRDVPTRTGFWLRASRAALLSLLFLAFADSSATWSVRNSLVLSRLCLGAALCRLSPPCGPRGAVVSLEARRDAGRDVCLEFQLDERYSAGGSEAH